MEIPPVNNKYFYKSIPYPLIIHRNQKGRLASLQTHGLLCSPGPGLVWCHLMSFREVVIGILDRCYSHEQKPCLRKGKPGRLRAKPASEIKDGCVKVDSTELRTTRIMDYTASCQAPQSDARHRSEEKKISRRGKGQNGAGDISRDVLINQTPSTLVMKPAIKR